MQKTDEALRKTARSRTPTACLQCQKRKQKCSREQPCRHCSRRYPPVDCIYTCEGRHKMVPPVSPNRLSVPDETPEYIYTEVKPSINQLPSAPFRQGFSGTAQSYAYHQDPEQNLEQGNMSCMKTFASTSPEYFTTKYPYQVISSSVAPSSGTASYTRLELDTNELDFQQSPHVPMNAPNEISDYNCMGEPHLEGESWNQTSNLDSNTGMNNFQDFNQSHFVPISIQTENCQSFGIQGSPKFHLDTGNNGLSSFEVPDLSFSPETPNDQNRGYGATDSYSFY
ncbi:4022f46e-9e6b-4e78-829a-3bef11a99bc1 [Sclerotinia trifoliorum]|uniref:4022f46e-9e6b-4e78-829a-3bef11a99bc1 n=1 Tax=Sclerotinia trifoliorum TaxID=28548 RepID=A0A8H2VUI3_9HELO|nr:4022f46e-9e6b-4e78-829a-3bef11a99bc1 [Sclerotinia trifoliorum]